MFPVENYNKKCDMSDKSTCYGVNYIGYQLCVVPRFRLHFEQSSEVLPITTVE